MTHTPGPWIPLQAKIAGHWITSVIMTNQDGIEFSNQINDVAVSNEESLANARLIARAPAMQAAISAAIAKLEGPGMPDRAREAIHILTEVQDD